MIKNILILSCLFFLGLIGCSESSKGHRYYLPEMYSGWICVYYEVDNEPQLPVEDGFLVEKIPLNGILKTSSKPRGAKLKNEYFYYGAKGVRPAKELQHGGGFTVQQKDNNGFVFYWWVSSHNANEDYEQYVKNRDTKTAPPCGPWVAK